MRKRAGRRGTWAGAAWWIGLVLVAAAPGCREAPAEKAAGPQTPAGGPVVDLDGLKQAVAGYRGKVVYVDFWATWCGPCVKGLPELSRLQDRYGPRGLQVVTVSFDEADHWAKKAVPVLNQAGWRGPALIMKDKAAREAAIAWLARSWKGELPARYLFNREGEAVQEILGGDAGHSRVEGPIEELLGPAGG